jgi:hypothetical protein
LSNLPPTENVHESDKDSPGSASERLLGARLVALFAVGSVLFGYPILGLFSRPQTAFGLPLLYLYLFGAWALYIAVLAWLVESRERRL